MKIHAAISIVPVRVVLDLPDDTPVGEIRDKVIEQAHDMITNNGTEHVVLSASLPGLVESLGNLNQMGFPVVVEYVETEPEEPDWYELTRIRNAEQ